MSKVYIPSNANVGNSSTFNQKASKQHRDNKKGLTAITIISMIGIITGAYVFAVAVVNSF